MTCIKYENEQVGELASPKTDNGRKRHFFNDFRNKKKRQIMKSYQPISITNSKALYPILFPPLLSLPLSPPSMPLSFAIKHYPRLFLSGPSTVFNWSPI